MISEPALVERLPLASGSSPLRSEQLCTLLLALGAQNIARPAARRPGPGTGCRRAFQVVILERSCAGRAGRSWRKIPQERHKVCHLRPPLSRRPDSGRAQAAPGRLRRPIAQQKARGNRFERASESISLARAIRFLERARRRRWHLTIKLAARRQQFAPAPIWPGGLAEEEETIFQQIAL